MKIILVIYSLSYAGGAERVLTIMANYWAERGWKVCVATFDHGENKPFYNLSPLVKHEPLSLASESSNPLGSILNNYKRVTRLKHYFTQKKPDVIISFVAKRNILTLLSTLKTGIPVIVSERKNPALSSEGFVSRYLKKWLYPKASGVVCQTKEMLDYFLPTLEKNAVIIPNPALKAGENRLSPEISLPEGKLLFAVGSMNSKEKVKQKGFDLLLLVFYTLVQKYNDWNLVILGDGPERQVLIDKAKDLHLENRVYFPGVVENIHSVLKHGDLFVLSSRYEGFPNALTEAMSCGLPAVSFDCPTGPGEIIRNGIDGWLVHPEDLEGLEDALSKMMADKDLRKKMGEKAADIVTRFDIEKIMEQWESIIYNSISGKIKTRGVS